MQTFADFTFTTPAEVKLCKTGDGIEVTVDGTLLEHVRIRVPKLADLMVDQKIGIKVIDE